MTLSSGCGPHCIDGYCCDHEQPNRTWPVRHPGIGVLHYATQQEAITAAGTAGTVLKPVEQHKATLVHGFPGCTCGPCRQLAQADPPPVADAWCCATCRRLAEAAADATLEAALEPATIDADGLPVPAPTDTPAKPPQTGSAGRVAIPDEAVAAFVRAYDDGCCNDSQADWCCTRHALAAVWPHLAATLLLPFRELRNRWYAMPGMTREADALDALLDEHAEAFDLVFRRADELEGGTGQEGHGT